MFFKSGKRSYKKRIASLLKRIAKYLKLPFKKKLLYAEAFVLMGIARFCILFIPFRYLAGTMGEQKKESTYELNSKEQKTAVEISSAVQKMSRFTPWESKCLVQALTAQIILRQNGIASTLYLGMAKEDSNRLLAHAWLRCGGIVITGGNTKDNFKMVTYFASLTRQRT